MTSRVPHATSQKRRKPPHHLHLMRFIALPHLYLLLILQLILFKMSNPQAQEPNPDPRALTSNPGHNSETGVDYEPHPSSSIPLSPQRQRIVDSICRLYSGSASEVDMQVYAEKAIYDDPWSYCDTRYKIAGQWYGEFHLIFLECVWWDILIE
jgi:hypothetical protein